MSGKTTMILSEVAQASILSQVLRYSAGSAIIMLIASGADYTLSYLTPVLALPLLTPGAKSPTPKSIAAFLITVAIACAAGVVFTRLFLNFPLVFLPLLTLVIFHIYYMPSFQKMKVWLIIALLLIPMVSLESKNLGNEVAINLFVNAFLAISLAWLIFLIFPCREHATEEAKAEVLSTVNERQRFVSAMNKTLVVFPVLVLFFFYNWSNALLVLIFIAILSMNPATANKKAGIAIIAANLGGGLAAIVVFNLMVVVPSFLFFGMLVFFAGLLFGRGLLSKKSVAPLFGMAYSTFLLILGNVLAFRGEAGEEVWLRIFQLSIVVVYIVIAFRVVEHFSSHKKLTPG